MVSYGLDNTTTYWQTESVQDIDMENQWQNTKPLKTMVSGQPLKWSVTGLVWSELDLSQTRSNKDCLTKVQLCIVTENFSIFSKMQHLVFCFEEWIKTKSCQKRGCWYRWITWRYERPVSLCVNTLLGWRTILESSALVTITYYLHIYKALRLSKQVSLAKCSWHFTN